MKAHLSDNQIDEQSKVEIVKLVYSLAASGRERRTLIADKLDELNLPFLDENYEPETYYLDNSAIPSFIHIRISSPFGAGWWFCFHKNSPNFNGSIKFYSSSRLFSEKSESNVHFYTMMSAYLTNLGCKSYVTESKSGMTSLRVEGVRSVLPLIPLFQSNIGFNYWKSDSVDLLFKFFKHHAAGLSTHRKGVM